MNPFFTLLSVRAKHNSHRGDRLKRKLHTDPAVQEDLQIQRRMMDLLEQSERRNTERLDKTINNICSITNTIHEGFALLRQLKSQLQHIPIVVAVIDIVIHPHARSPHHI